MPPEAVDQIVKLLCPSEPVCEVAPVVVTWSRYSLAPESVTGSSYQRRWQSMPDVRLASHCESEWALV